MTDSPGSPDVRARARFVRVSARKARLVVDNIRGRTVPEARTILAFTPRVAAREVEKVLGSAVANAFVKHQWDGDELVISAAYVDEGPTMKRFRPRARGRATRIFKRTCHITIELVQPETVGASGSAGEQAKRARKQAGGAASAAKSKRAPKKKEAAV